MLIFLENLKALAFMLIFISSIMYYRQLKLLKKQRRLTKIEKAMDVITMTATFTFAFIYILLIIGT
ncbi:hypothetical protein A21D_03439 [Virgibacillus dokdonensis]|uniref:Uncharacterized protein n=1 Tax=Virgibacillus dokdonensis TaxID=302167 RepID=A0A2K9J5Q4_9BACI|nr:hypothetical protein A21D_03439 [Virgibacillus dokdonensis]